MSTYSGYRYYIVIAGKRNSGKSSLVNAVVNQNVSIVSDYAGTTTDPVYKTMELYPLGPVTIVDTPGIDDIGDIGELRTEKAKKAFYKADIGILTVDTVPGEYENEIISIFKKMRIPYIIAVNKYDENKKLNLEEHYRKLGQNVINVSAKERINIDNLKDMIYNVCPKEDEKNLIPDFIEKGDTVLLVIPVDKSAPKGKIIMPQIVAIREILDRNANAVICQDTEITETLDKLKEKPKIVITDSQAIMKIENKIPVDIMLTTFSILEAKSKGDLKELTDGVKVIDNLKDGDKILVMEGCNHRPLTEDIGRVKIPKWLINKTGKDLRFSFIAGKEFPDEEDLKDIKLVIHCGGCTLTRNMMLRRIHSVTRNGIPIVNYGVIISYLHGVLDRVISMF